MQFFSYHIACREDSVASKEPMQALSPHAHTIRNANIINTVRRRDFSGPRILYNCLILKATFKFLARKYLNSLGCTPYWTVLKTEKPRRVRRNSNIGHQCHEIASVYHCTPAMEKKTSELMHSKSTFLF